jgi:hypothetical protein
MAEADPKLKQFDVLYSTLGELQKGLLSSTTQVAGFLLLAIGWLATSANTFPLLHSRPTVRYMAAAALCGAFVLYAYGACMVYTRSQKTFKMLIQVDLMPVDFYESNVLNLRELFIFIAGTFFLFGLAAGCVLWG